MSTGYWEVDNEIDYLGGTHCLKAKNFLRLVAEVKEIWNMGEVDEEREFLLLS
jgi:hypothetical protein